MGLNNTKVQVKRELMIAAKAGILARLGEVRGWHFLSNAEVQEINYRTLRVKVPGSTGPSYFEISVKESF